MALEEIISRSITGIRPFNELPIDAEIWREAHNHHSLHRHLHSVALHRPGIVYGLEVVASTVKDRTIVVAPGVGIDSNGQTIVLNEPVSFNIEETRQIYIILSFLRAADRKSAVTVGGGQQFYREVEGRDLKQTKELPTTPYLELGRIFRSGPDKPIKDAVKAFTPANDEINLLYRPIAFPHCFADIGVGELSYVPKAGASAWNPNRAGLWNLVREGNGSGFHLAFTGPLNLRAGAFGANDPALIYVAGEKGFQPLADAEIDGVRRYLDSGGLLFAESCAGDKEFESSFMDMASKIGVNLQDITVGHPLLTAHHVFSAPPPGGQEGRLQGDLNAGVFFGTHDYGAAWQGEIANPAAPDARARIRGAQEFGLNIIAFAARRRRMRELAAMG